VPRMGLLRHLRPLTNPATAENPPRDGGGARTRCDPSAHVPQRRLRASWACRAGSRAVACHCHPSGQSLLRTWSRFWSLLPTQTRFIRWWEMSPRRWGSFAIVSRRDRSLRGCRSLSQKTASPPSGGRDATERREVGSHRSPALRFTDPGAGNSRSHTYLGDRNACNAGNVLGGRPIRLDHHRCHRCTRSPRLSVRAKIDLCGRAARVRGRKRSGAEPPTQ
jgi:hypothetical protein